MQLTKKPYEISIWKNAYTGPKLAVIGAHNMESPTRALRPVFNKEMNGLSPLSFDMVLSYIDPATGTRVQNPLVGMLQPETHIKLKYENKWYPLLIKTIDDKSVPNMVSYTCKYLPINELSRTGYSLEFNTELENNMGTAKELAVPVVEGTDWEIIDGDIILEKIEEPIYEITSTINAISSKKITTTENITIPSNSKIFLFYSDISQLKTGEISLQLLWMEDYKTDIHGLIISDDENFDATFNVIQAAQEWVFSQSGAEKFRLPIAAEVSAQFRAEKLIKNQAVKYDPVAEQYVAVYEKNGQTYYGFQKTRYNSPTIVTNLVTNGENFLNTVGWSAGDNADVTIDFVTSGSGDSFAVKSYLKTNIGNSRIVYNSGIRDHLNLLREGLVVGDVFVARIKASASAGGSLLGNNLIQARLTNSEWINFATKAHSPGWLVAEIPITTTKSSNELRDENIRIEIKASSNRTIYIEDFQVYEKLLDRDNAIIHPDTIDIDSIAEVVNYYYDPTQSYGSNKDIIYTQKSIGEDPSFTPVYREDYEKVRSITISKSNRFNILQEIAEKMECWVDLQVEFDEQGYIVEDPITGKPKKTIQFIKQKGKRRYAGFEYGIDLVSIQRTVNSDQITTKVIVSPNSNEFAEKGFCAIGYSKENYSGEDFIYNFQYYVSKGLIPSGLLNNDLYGVGLGQGLLTKLHAQNQIINPLIEEQVLLREELTRLEADEGFYQTKADAADAQAATYKSYFISSTKQADFAKAEKWFKDNPTHITAKEYYTKYNEMLKQKSASETLLSATISKLQRERNKADAIEIELEELAAEKKEWVDAFEQKYASYIQEGSWISEDYYDPNLYYLDAEQVLRDSANPEVRYNIQVVDLSSLEAFKNKKFELGDITTIEDVEFFGYIWKDGRKTPYREEVIITKISYPLDEPDKVVLSLQNYRTQFQDLFQRITATTQNLQFAQGGYERAAAIVDDDGLIKYNVLQNSLIVNRDLVYSSLNDSIVQDNTGITLTDLENMRNAVRITSKGIFYTNDGGETWPLGLNAQGISASAVTSGVLYTDNVIISKGGLPTFRWDGDGISAYTFGDYGVDKSAFVRLDQYGLYGVQGNQDFIPTASTTTEAIQEIWDNAMFSLTWEGFNLKTKGGEIGDGYIRITSDLDQSPGITVTQNGIDRVAIGYLGDGVYGLRLKNAQDLSVLSADSNGDLVIDNAIYIASNSKSPITIGRKEGYRKLNLAEGNDLPQIAYELIGTEYVLTEDTGADPLKTYYEKVTEVFNANNRFMIYEDGRMDALEGHFQGIVHATSGSFMGHIEAASGFFRGDVYADGGHIGSAIISQDRLRVENGIFEIGTRDIGNQGDFIPQLIFNEEDGLRITGDAVFEGILNATKGKIGGISIEENALTLSIDNEILFQLSQEGLIANAGAIGGLLLTNEGLFAESGNFSLTQDGHAYMENLTIGSAAVIEDYIQLGSNSFLYNADINEGKVLQSGELLFHNDGRAEFGDITVDANHSSIYADNAWSLTPELASFRNISASGSISSMVFEPATVRAVGGSMIFKESVKPLSVNGNIIQLKEEDAIFFMENDYVFLNYEDGEKQVIKVSSVDTEADTITLDTPTNDSNLVSITIFGQAENSVGKDWIIGVNASNTRFENFLEPNAITFSEFSLEDGIKYTPKIVLGRLTTEMTGGIETHGLYAESAYLTGSLTTKNGNFYAGVNTLAGHTFSKEFEELYLDTSPIVFWAGANSQSEASVQSAAFQVTQEGTLYAQRGYFEDSIISNATIRASVLEATTISGTGQSPALRILSTKDSVGGIEFLEDDTSATPTLRITDKGLFLFGEDAIIQQNHHTILNAEGHLISEVFNIQEDGTSIGSIVGNQNRIEIRHKDALQAVYVGNNEFVSQTGISHFYKDVKFGNYIGEVTFERNEDGYDVYVK